MLTRRGFLAGALPFLFLPQLQGALARFRAPRVALTERDNDFVERAFVTAREKGKSQPWYVFAYNEGMGRTQLDGRYWLPATRRDLEQMVAWAHDLTPPLDERRDCEDYAIWTKAAIDREFLCNGAGIVVDWSSYPVPHSYNVAMLADGTVLVIEPQDGTLFSLEEKRTRYQLQWGVMLF